MKDAVWLLIFQSICLTGGIAEVRAAEPQPKANYHNSFEQAELNKVPEEFLVLDGAFAVREESGNKFLELPEAPLDTFGLLFGSTEKENRTVSARIYGTGKGRRFPTFGVGLNGQGAGAYRLQVSPAKKALELYKGDAVKVSVPFDWKSGEWTVLKLQVKKAGAGEWKIEGKAWPQNAQEPDWLVSASDNEEPLPGRASIWGSPYSDTPIRFDDLTAARQ